MKKITFISIIPAFIIEEGFKSMEQLTINSLIEMTGAESVSYHTVEGNCDCLNYSVLCKKFENHVTFTNPTTMNLMDIKESFSNNLVDGCVAWTWTYTYKS